MVQQTWDTSGALYHSRLALQLFHKKLKLLKFGLRALNRTHYGNLPQRTKQAFENLCALQHQALVSPSQLTFDAVSGAAKKWDHLATIEENFFRQKSRLQWLKAGDQNTSNFHRAAQGRASRNSIKQLTTEVGELLTSPEAIKKEAALHFQRFLQTQTHGTDTFTIESIQELLTFRCSTESGASMVAPVTTSEIQAAIHSLPNDKVSGPDGYTKEFFVAAWPVYSELTSSQQCSRFSYLVSSLKGSTPLSCP